MKKKTKLKCKSCDHDRDDGYDAGGFIQGAASMGASGAAFGPFGIAGGALIGGILGSLSQDDANANNQALQKKQMDYERKIGEENSIYRLPGGYNQYTPGTVAQFVDGGRISAEADGYKSGGGVKLIKGGGKKGKVKKVHSGDFVIPNPSVEKFKQDTGLHPSGEVTEKSKGNTKIVAGEGNKPELLVKRGTVNKLAQKGVNLNQYAPNAAPGKKKQAGGPTGPYENPMDYAYDFGAEAPGSEQIKKDPNGIPTAGHDSLYDMRGVAVPSAKREFGLSMLDNTGNPNNSYVPPAPEQTGNSPFVNRMLGIISNTPKIGSIPTTPTSTTTPAVTQPKSADKIVDQISNYNQIANAGILLSNLLQRPPQMKQPSSFVPELEDNTGQILAEKAAGNRDINQTVAGERSVRQQAGISFDKDLVGKALDARVKLGANVDRAITENRNQNLERINNANLYNLGVKQNFDLNQFNLQNQYQHEKALGVEKALSNVSGIEKQRLEGHHHLQGLNEQNRNTEYDKFITMQYPGQNVTGLPSREAALKMSDAEWKQIMTDQQRQYDNYLSQKERNSTLDATSLRYNIANGGSFSGSSWMGSPK